MRDAKRRRTQSPIGSDESASCTGVPVYEILPERDVQKILDATFALMGEIDSTFSVPHFLIFGRCAGLGKRRLISFPQIQK